MVDQTAKFDLFRGFLAYMENQQLVSSAVSSLASVQSNTSLVFYGSPRLIDHFRPSVYLQVPHPLLAPVRGSGSGRGWGPQGRPPHRGLASSVPARLVAASDAGLERDRSWGAPSWGYYGEGAPTTAEDQAYLGLDYGEYGYSSGPYRPHAFERQPPPSDFGSEFEFSDPSAFPEDDFFR